MGESYRVDDAGDRIPIERVEWLRARGRLTRVAAGHFLASYFEELPSRQALFHLRQPAYRRGRF